MKLKEIKTGISLMLFASSACAGPLDEIITTDEKKISTITVGVDGSWFIKSEDSWNLQGCNEIEVLKIESSHPNKVDYINLLSTINDYSKAKIKAHAYCDKYDNSVITAGKFISITFSQ
ncbi:hypothetical protein BTO10_07585 [Vibrio chagasii]|uniref:Uncharacterized protein n=1 Tax=Vibrio chagasii TaxID=170679 RepID=A0A2S7VS02_9VIBR|nr:hypothetical protein [Vibrio chagasii]PQJ64625.1 hypothetical protein BTO10_07585 [Vibrio chagasii]|tara:strand:- start:531 stop:887 length:357 start_codon:yes stop_codon:yes gene_type:complete